MGEAIPYLTAEEIKKENKIKQLFQGYRGDSSEKLGLKIINNLSSHLKKSKKEIRFLECGTGSGYFCLDMYNNGFTNIYGTDIDDYRNQEVIKQGIFKDFQTLDLSWDKIPWTDNYFELLTAWCVLPHLENPHNCIREAHRVLRPDGIFILSMPHVNSIYAKKIFFKTGNLIRYTDNNNHISVFTPHLFKKLILRYFDLLAVEYYINPGVYQGRFGSIKRMGIEKQWFGQQKFKNWYGTNIIYVIKNKPKISI